MKPKSKQPQRRVVLWPQRKVYECYGELQQSQRVPLLKVNVLSKSVAFPLYFECDPIVLN